MIEIDQSFFLVEFTIGLLIAYAVILIPEAATVTVSQQALEREPRIRVRPGVGSVRIEAAALFSPRGDAHIHDLVARLFQRSVVSAVDVYREGLAVVIHYDATRCSAGRALRTFAEALDAPRCPCPLVHSLQRIP